MNTKQYQTNTLTDHIFRLVNGINMSKPNSLAVSAIFIIISLLNRLSIVIPTNFNSNNYNLLEKIFLNVIYYSDLTNLITYGGLSNSNLVIIYLLSYYCWGAFLFLFSLQYYKMQESQYLRYFMTFLGTVFEISCWVTFLPAYQCFFAEIINGSGITTQILAGIALPAPIILVALFNYCEYEVNYIGSDYIHSKFSRIQTYMAIAKIGLTLLQQITVIANAQGAMAYFNTIVALFDIYYFYNYFPICNRKLNRLYFVLTWVDAYMNWPIYSRLHLNYNYDCSFVGIVGGLIFAGLAGRIYHKRKWNLMFERDFFDLNMLQMDWVSRKIISYIKCGPQKKARASLKLLLFLKNHTKRCIFDECPCHSIEWDHLIAGESKGKLFQKTIFTLALKSPVMRLLSFIFRRKVATTHREKNIDFAINYATMLFCHTEEYMMGFSDLTTILTTRRNLKLSQLFRVHTLQKALEDLLNKSASVTQETGSNFDDVILFYNIMDNLRKKMGESLDKYMKFYDELKKWEIQMDIIVKYGGEIRTVQDIIRDYIDRLYQLNKDNNQLTRLVYLYASLGIILEDKNKKISNLFRDAGQFIQRIKKNGNFPDVFDEECTVLFISLNESKLGVVRKASPYIKTMFGYDYDTSDVLHVEQLMPRAFGEHHDQFLKEFVQRSDYKRLNKYIDVFGQTRDGFSLACDLYLKLEVVQGELLVASFLKSKSNSLLYMLCGEQGLVVSYSQKLHTQLGLQGDSNKDVIGLPIALLSPRLILFYLFHGEQAQNIFIKVVLGLLDNNDDGEDDHKNEPPEEFLLANERLYFCLPHNKEILSHIVTKIKTLLSPQNLLVKKRFDIERDLLSLLQEAYALLKPENISLFKINCHFKKNLQRGDVVKLNFLEIMKVDKLEGLEKKEKFLQLSREFLENVSNYHLQYNPGQYTDPQQMFRFLYKDLLHELTPGTMISIDQRKSNEQESNLPEDSKVRDNNMLLPDTYYQNKKGTQDLQKRKLKALAALMRQGMIKKELIQSMGSNSHSSKPRELMVHMESENPNQSHNYSETEQEADGIDEKMAGLETEQVQMIQKSESKESLPKIDITNYRRPNNRSMTVMKAVGTLYNEFESNKDANSESNQFANIDNDDLSSDEKRRKKKVVFEAKVQERMYAPDKEEERGAMHEKQSAASSKTASSATSKLFKTLLLDSRPPVIVETIQIYGFAPLLMIIGVSIALYFATKSKISDYTAFNNHADFASELLVNYATFGKHVETLFLAKNLLDPASFNTLATNDMIAKAYKFEKKSFNNYKAALTKSITNFRLQDITEEFNLDNYNFRVSQLDSNNQRIFYDISSGHMIVHAAGVMKNILNFDISQYQEFESNIFYLRTNLDVYAKGLTQMSLDLQNKIIDLTKSGDSKWVFYQLMIVDISIVILLMGLFVQVYSGIVKVKDKGLSLLITINKTIIDEKVFDCQAVQKSIQDVNMDLDTAYKTLNFNHVKQDKNKAYRIGKNVSHTSNEFLVFFAAAIIVGGAFVGYYLGCMYISVNAINALGPILEDYKTISSIRSYYATDYNILYQSMNLWSGTSIPTSNFEARFADYRTQGSQISTQLLNYIAQLESYFDGNNYISDNYKTTLLALKYNDVCDFLTNTTEAPLCSNALQRISKVGLTPTLNKVLNLINTYYLNQIDLGYTQNATIKTIADTNFIDLDSYLDYGEDILSKYMLAIKENISTQLTDLDSKLLSFTVVGCIILALVFLIGWQLFVHKLKRDILVVKRTFSVLPLDLILSNNFIKKFLKDNSKNA